jgi:adenylosuccinate lyase
MVALIQVLEEDHPGVTFHYGLTSEDIMANSRFTQVDLAISKINSLLTEAQQHIITISEPVKTFVLSHTHGQPATPIKLEPYLRAKFKHLSLIRPAFRFGGSNGQLTALAYATGIDDFANLGASWLRRVKHHHKDIETSKIVTPAADCGLLQVGPSNEATFLSAISVCLKGRALARALWDHCQRKILGTVSPSGQAGSSAMPQKNNPIDAELAEGCFSNAYHIFLNSLEANCDSRGLRDLSNSVVNRQMMDGWCFLYLGLRSLISFLSKASYDRSAIIKELKQHPESLTELLRYYMQVEEGKSDPYWELKERPPTDFDETISRMSNWSIM